MSHQYVHDSVQRASVEFFTPEEHRILAEWFGQEPHPAATGCSLDEALERLGVTESPHTLYRETDPAVAFIVLEGVEHELPNCGVFDGERVNLTRAYRPQQLVPQRRVCIVPQHLFTVNWADTAPGISWPGAYYCTWVPCYERYVVTYSGDCPEVFGYCDIAIGHFGLDETLKEGSRRVVTDDWQRQYGEFNQGRWAYLFFEGLLDGEEAATWADVVWPEGYEE